MGGPYNILVVDDEVDFLEIVTYIFQKRGHHVLQANCGNAAIEIFKNNPIDIVLSDVRMPNGSGIDLLNVIRSRDPKIPAVILISGFTDCTTEELLAKGANSVMAKPFDTRVLLEVVEQLLSEKSSRDSLAAS